MPPESSDIVSAHFNPARKCHLRLVVPAPKAKRPPTTPAPKQDELEEPVESGAPGVPLELAGMPERLRALRENAGYTSRRKMDDAAEIANGRTGRIESGDRLKGISALTVVKLAKKLAVSADYILTGVSAPVPLKDRQEFLEANARAFLQWGESAPHWAWRAAEEIAFPLKIRVTPELIRDCAVLIAHHGRK